MLIVANKKVKKLNIPSFQRRFGRQGIDRPDWIDDILENFITDEYNIYRFDSADALARDILHKQLRGQPLRLWYYNIHPIYTGPYTITMSGSRKDDIDLANIEANLYSTPDGYTWHHAEGITEIRRGEYACRMCLVKSSYHRNSHYGGVHEYELITGIKYQ